MSSGPDTNRLVNRESFALMKPSAILINTGRGPLIDDDAVAEALRNGKLAAFGADVLTTEPPASDNPLLSAPQQLHHSTHSLGHKKRHAKD